MKYLLNNFHTVVFSELVYPFKRVVFNLFNNQRDFKGIG